MNDGVGKPEPEVFTFREKGGSVHPVYAMHWGGDVETARAIGEWTGSFGNRTLLDYRDSADPGADRIPFLVVLTGDSGRLTVLPGNWLVRDPVGLWLTFSTAQMEGLYSPVPAGPVPLATGDAARAIQRLVASLEVAHYDERGNCPGCGLTAYEEAKPAASCPVRLALARWQADLVGLLAPPSEPEPEVLRPPYHRDRLFIGHVVHYVSHGSTPREDGTQDYPSQCRAAVVAAIHPDRGGLDGDGARVHLPAVVDLAVLDPGGVFFRDAEQDEDGRARCTWHQISDRCTADGR